MTRLFSSLAVAVGAWVLVSFGGAMIDPAHAGLWTQSLMASLLTSLVLAPVLFVLRQRKDADVRTDATAQTKAANQAEEPFVDEKAGQMRTLWPQDDNEDRQQEAPQQSRQLA